MDLFLKYTVDSKDQIGEGNVHYNTIWVNFLNRKQHYFFYYTLSIEI